MEEKDTFFKWFLSNLLFFIISVGLLFVFNFVFGFLFGYYDGIFGIVDNVFAFIFLIVI